MAEQHLLSRRAFMRLAAGAMATAALGGLAGCAPSSISTYEANRKATETISCDVLVVGGGAAGTTAAAEAATEGARTVLLEKYGWLAGSSSLAIGTLYGAGTTLQKEAGIDDNPEGLYEYFMSRGGDKLDPEMQRFCAEHFGETIDWMRNQLGIPFKETVSKKGKDPVPRGHNIDANAQVALGIMEKRALDAGADFHFEVAAESLVTDESGAVTGVLARKANGDLVRYEAQKTILATGGFCRNPEMIATYCPDYEGVYTEVGEGCTGEGLQMGLDIGAAYIGHGGTNGILACPVSAGQSKLIDKKAMWISSDGTRFANEDGQTHDIYYAVAHFPDQKFYAVYDQAMVDALSADLKQSFDLGIERGLFTSGETVAEAANGLGIDGAAAQAQLDAYNAAVAAGVDEEFSKKPENLVPLTQAPYYVLTMGVCTHGSFGGYNVNTNFEVLDENGNPLPNLLAAGEVCCGSFIYDDYPAGGCGLNFSYTSGRHAGLNAAKAVQR